MTKSSKKQAAQLSPEDKAQITNEAQLRGVPAQHNERDQFDAMDRAALLLECINFDLDDCDGMSDDEIRAELRNLAALAADDAAAQAEFDNRQRIAAEAEAARIAADNAIEANHPLVRTEAPAAAIVLHNVDLPKAGRETEDNKGVCPHCLKPTRNGKDVTEFSEMSPSAQNTTNQQFTCNKCCGEWGPVVDKPKRARAPSGTSNGLKIEQNRETRNGVTRPSAGGKCRGVWDMLDAIGTDATAKQAREAAQGKFDKTTTMVQFYRWRKFHGIEGRQ
jgi:hypothetical protein